MYEQSVMRSLSEPTGSAAGENKRLSLGLSGQLQGQKGDFYPKVAMAALVKLLQDSSLAVHHSSATQTVIEIFKALGASRSVAFLGEIVPFFLEIVRRSGPGLRESILQQLAQLVCITGQHIATFLPSIFDLLKDYWTEHLEYILSIVQQMAVATADTFSVTYVSQLLPLLLSSLSIKSQPRGGTATSHSDKGIHPKALKPLSQILRCCITLRKALRPYISLIVPALCKLLGELQELSDSHAATGLPNSTGV